MVDSYDGSNYDYHFTKKELAEELEKQFACLGENTDKYLTFTIPREQKLTRIEKNGEDVTKNISYIVKFIDSASFIASSLSNVINNLSEGIHKIKCKHGQNDKKCETCGITYEICKCFLECTIFEDELIGYKNCKKL